MATLLAGAWSADVTGAGHRFGGRAVKRSIVAALGLVVGGLVLAFWIAPGWMNGAVGHALGLRSARDPHDFAHLKTMVIADLRQHGADCADVKEIEARGKDGADTLEAAILCTSGEAYELRMHPQSPWEYRRVR